MKPKIERPLMSPFDLCALLREAGWMVCSHNDFDYEDRVRTYWSFCRGNQFVDASGEDDNEALMGCLVAARNLMNKDG